MKKFIAILLLSALPAFASYDPLGLTENQGDTSPTLTVGKNAPVVIFTTTLTANRTITLSTTNARQGDKFRVVRQGLGLFTLDVGGLKTIASATSAFVEVTYNGSAWVLTGYSTL